MTTFENMLGGAATAAFAAFALGLAAIYLLAYALWRSVRGSGSRLRTLETRLREHPWAERVAMRFPRLGRFLRRRLTVEHASGLPLTALFATAAGLAWLLAELAEEVVESPQVERIDLAIMQALEPLRVDRTVDVFKFVTDWGSSSTVVAVGVACMALYWHAGRGFLVWPLWLTVVGAQLTTAIGKQVFDRARPTAWSFVAETSPSFPSGHSTAAMAVYGFLAYSVWRGLPSPRGRFEVPFWGAVLVALIGFSRVLLGVHFPSDVLSGFLVGAIWLLAGIAWCEWLAARRAAQENLDIGTTK